ncbi:MAG TPA: universal stress protein [Thermodesulfovibrionales bacterium]|nr:universal stress protein [Thermodesulfovibrionales bacterium]
MKKFEDTLTAATFAQAGETDKAREVFKERRRVLLALREEEIESKVLKYAMNTSKRIGADLDILYISSSSSPEAPILTEFFSLLEKEGIEYRLVRRSGRLREEIRNYTESERGIHFVVVESLAVDRWNKEEGLSEIVDKMKCPLVVVDIP